MQLNALFAYYAYMVIKEKKLEMMVYWGAEAACVS